MSQRAALIFGIDGGTWRILTRAVEGGHMPFLSQLMDSGSWGDLISTVPAITPAAWSTFQTGTPPGEHGVIDFTSWDSKKQQRVRADSTFLRRTLWDVASGHDCRVGVVNVPMTYPPREVNGFMVSGMMTPSAASQFTYPPELRAEILSRWPEYAVMDLHTIQGLSPHDNHEAFIASMAEDARLRRDLARRLIERGRPDLFMVHFQTSDVLQHALWWYIDPECPEFSEEIWERAAEGFYRALDDCMRDVAEAFADTTDASPTIVAMSDHGMQPHRTRFHLGNWLLEKGYLVQTERSDMGSGLIDALKALDVLGLRRLLMPENKRSEVARRVRGDSVNREASQAFALGRSTEGMLYLTREADDPDWMQAAQRLREDLLTVEYPETGQKVATEVGLKPDLFAGARSHLAPDLLLHPTPGFTCSGNPIPGEGLFHPITPDVDLHLGMHEMEGIVVVDCPHAASRDEQAGGGRLIDVAPTILTALGIPAPDWMQGESLLQSSDVRKAAHEHPSRDEDADGSEPSEGYSEEEEAILEKRLRDLGYL